MFVSARPKCFGERTHKLALVRWKFAAIVALMKAIITFYGVSAKIVPFAAGNLSPAIAATKLWNFLTRSSTANPNEEWNHYIQPNKQREIICRECYDFIKEAIDSAKEKYGAA